MNYKVLGEGCLAFFVNMVMNFEVLYKTHNFLKPKMTVIYACRVLIIIKRLHSSGHTHTHTHTHTYTHTRETLCVWSSGS